MNAVATVNLSALIAHLKEYRISLAFTGAIQNQQNFVRNLTPDEIKYALEWPIAGALYYCELVPLKRAWETAHGIKSELMLGHRYSPELMIKAIERLERDIVQDLAALRFAYVTPGLEKYFNEEKLFGDEVYDKFKDARDDIKAAGDCLAMELCTASVFHLMRVAEYGLRALARKLRIQLTHTGKRLLIEFADWNTIITGAKNKITKARSLAPGPKREAQLELYSDAADHCAFMKDIWRNNVSHSRKPYSLPEAIAVFERVRDFMAFLAKHDIGHGNSRT